MRPISAGLWPGFGAAMFYGVSSASMAFANKAIMSSYGFDFPFTILVIQMLVSIVAVLVLDVTGTVHVPKYTLERAGTFFLPSLCSALHSCLSLIALKGMNIPMYGALKRCTPLVNLVLSVVLLQKPFPPTMIIASVLLITLGCLIAGIGDLSFDTMAYFVGTLSVVVQGLYQTLIQKAAERDMTVFEIFQLNCYNSLPMFALGSIIINEPISVSKYPHLADHGFLFCLTIVVVLGSVLNYSLFLSTSINSALTTSLVGVMKSVLQTIIGFFTFGGVMYNPVNVAGIVLNSLGGMLYTYAKFKGSSFDKTCDLSKLSVNKESMKSFSNGVSQNV